MAGRRLLHYEIIEKLGQGGVSVVYKARDTRLDRFVALKFLMALRGSAEAARASLLREAQAISALSHPNIAALFDVAEAEGETFLVLEYLPGLTLRRRIDEGAGAGLPLGEAVTCALQMAQGLAHAHRRGIIHRDVKPGNAIFDAEGVLKLTDFGLAKWLTALQQTRPGTVLGTMAYLSPEQAEGRPADERSDVFSLGIVLYEMLAGCPPFRGDSETAALYQIVHAPLPDISALRPDLPAPLAVILGRALAKRPEERYPQMGLLGEDLLALARTLGEPGSQNAAALAASTRRHWEQSTIAPVYVPAPTRREAPLARRRWLAGAAAAAAVALPAGWYWFSQRAARPRGGSLLLLTGIHNRTGQAELDAVTDLLRNQLGQSAYFSLVNDVSLRELLERMVRPPTQKLDPQTARELAWRGRIPLVAFGWLDQLGSNYLLSLQLEVMGSQPSAPRAVWHRTFDANGPNDLFQTIREASNWIRATAGEAGRDLSTRNQPVEHTTTNSWEALRLFSQAEQRAFQDQDDDAVLLLKEAVKVDPDFAMAHGRLGDVCVELRRYAEGYRHWRQALEASQRRPLTQREEMRIRALYAMDTGDWQAAENLFRTFALYFPNDYYPRFYHALALEWSGRTQEAVEEFREAGRLQPSLYHMPAHLAMSLFTLGRFDQASREIVRVRAFGREFWARFLEGVADFLQGNWAAAEQRFESLTQCPDANWRSRGRALRACLLAELGRCEEALRILDEGLASDAKDGQIMAQADKLLAVAWIRSQRNERAACRAACLKAVELESGPSRLCRAGAVLARSGFPEEAEKLLPSLKPDLHLSAFRGAAHRILGEVLLARGQVAEALAEFRQAGALEYPARHREWLARALEASGDRAAACQLFQKAAASAALIWQAPEEELPGLWAECLFQYARLARVLGRDQEFGRAMKQYVALTTHADAGIGHAAEARAMLAAAGQNPDTR